MIARPIRLVMMKASRSLGLSRMTDGEGGSEARAMAAKVSMMRLTQSICVTVSGDSVPIMAPTSTMRQAERLTVSWKRRKRWIFW